VGASNYALERSARALSERGPLDAHVSPLVGNCTSSLRSVTDTSDHLHIRKGTSYADHNIQQRHRRP
jgi:hypothetical protein